MMCPTMLSWLASGCEFVAAYWWWSPVGVRVWLCDRRGIAAVALARFVGIAVGEYDKGQLRLERAVPDVEAVAGLLGNSSFECEILRDW
jgi:hypothetical protein